jgi:hypothetical protein
MYSGVEERPSTSTEQANHVASKTPAPAIHRMVRSQWAEVTTSWILVEGSDGEISLECESAITCRSTERDNMSLLTGALYHKNLMMTPTERANVPSKRLLFPGGKRPPRKGLVV